MTQHDQSVIDKKFSNYDEVDMPINDIKYTSSEEFSLRELSEPVENKTLSKFPNHTNELPNNVYKVISWNLDGLDETYLHARTLYFIDLVKIHKPSVLMLQEVVQFVLNIIKTHLSEPYHIIEPENRSTIELFQTDKNASCSHHGYFNIILVSKFHFQIDSSFTYYFNQSKMGRHIVGVFLRAIDCENAMIMFCSSHLESLLSSRDERKNQLVLIDKILDMAVNEREYDMAYFGGDTNIRQEELEQINLNVEKHLKSTDIYEIADEKTDSARYTWDTYKNRNKQSNKKYFSRMRFDRFYGLFKSGNFTVKHYMDAIGMQKIPNLNYYCSDHWGVQLYLEINKN